MLGGLKSGVFFAVWISALAAQPALAADCLVAPQPSVTFDGLSTLKDDHRENLSGLACGPASESGRVCLLVQDEGFRFAVGILKDGHLSFRSRHKLPDNNLDGDLDAEAVTYGHAGFVVLGSHSRKARKCLENNPAARQLIAVQLDADLSKSPAYVSSMQVPKLLAGVPDLAAKFDKCLGTTRPDNAVGIWNPEQGINFEGIALLDDRLFLGLRGPVLNGAAQVVETSLIALMGDAEPQAKLWPLLLDPQDGIRDIASYEGKLLLLSGPENNDQGKPAIYLWDGNSTVAQKLCDIPKAILKAKPEALLVLSGPAAKLHVLVLSDGETDGDPHEFVIDMP